MWIKFGVKTIRSGIYEPDFYQCPKCKAINSVIFGVESTYFHIWHIPVFPTEKDGFARCNNCALKIDSIKYNRLTKEQYVHVIRKKVKHPFYLYTFTLIFCIVLVLIIIGSST